MPSGGQQSSDGDNGDFDQSTNSSDSGDIAGANIPGTASSSQSSGNSQGSTADANGEMANSPDGTDTMGGMESGLPGSQPGSNMPGSTASNSAGDGDGGIDVSVQAAGLPGLNPFPGGLSLPGTNTASLEDIFGSGTQGTGTINGNSGSQGTGGATAGTGSGNDPLANGGLGGGSGEQGDDPFGGISSSGTIATGPTGGQGGTGDDPFGDLANGRNQPMTTAERQAVLDGRLNESMAVFDGIILTEREQAQGAANENGAGGIGGAGNANGTGGLGRDGDGSGDNPIVIASAPQSTSGTGRMPNMGRTREGDFDNSNQANFPAPTDIPSGNDDDVVARQLREAAMNESDPELRERLWDEYRTYTGLPIPQDAVAPQDAVSP
ncbi:MAG: hypothetical protein COA71_01055 [SAR86 cluster bacterium]|uniref:Uncharacterized protein n=1 Tax=SAR86 cluster bacterium TaxID=2030880 RepID=A0A2A5CJ13_9GAMM|nr:MAG: hypothetical protein COA71_01055 [SAR86 cluster bacterium]